MKCKFCKKVIADNDSYWEDLDGEFFCSEDCLDESEECKTLWSKFVAALKDKS